MAIRLTGMASGLDTESMITDLMSAYNGTKQKKVSTMTKYSWKMEAWGSLNKKINSFYSKALSNLRFSSSYSLKKTTVSDASKASVSAGSGAVTGTQTLAIRQMAQAGYLTGGVLKKEDGSAATAETTLGDLGYDGGETSISVKSGADGKYTALTINKDTKLSDLVGKLNSAGVNASFDAKNQRIFVNSKSSGATGDFSLLGDSTDAINALKSAGLYTGASAGSAEQAEYSKWASYGYTKDDAGNITLDENAVAAFDAEVASRVLKYQEATVAANEAIEKADKTIADNRKLLDGYTDDEGKEVVGLSTKMNSPYIQQATEKAAEIKSKIDNGTLTEDEAKEYGLSNLSDEDKRKVTLDTLTDTALKVEANKVSKQLAEAGEGERLALEEKSKALGEAISDFAAYTKATKAIEDAESEKTKQQGIISDAARYVDENGEATSELESGVKSYIADKIDAARSALSDTVTGDSSSAVRINGQNAQIYLNGAFFESEKNAFEINGLTINVTGTTGLTEDGKAKSPDQLTAADYNTISLTTSTDVDGIYKNIKNFIKEYNDLIKEMDTKYNADSAASYQVLSDEEKDAMSDSEVEAWEKKIKDSLLRRDDNLSSMIDVLKNSMQKTYEIGGKGYSLSSFGIETMSYFLAPEGEKGVYHIDGDEDDSETSGNADKLKAAIAADPEGLQEFFTKLTSDMYSALQKKASSTTNSSYGAFYEDKFMTKQYDTYKSQLSDYENKLKDIEDKYYKQFSAMESALTKLQSSTNAISGLLGM